MPYCLQMAFGLTLLCVAATGCGSLKAAAYFLSPAHLQKAEFEFPKDAMVAVVIDPSKPEFANPVFDKALYDRLVEHFRERKSTATLISPRETARLRREHPDFQAWPVRKVGQELGATHVLHITIDRLSGFRTRESPLLEPAAALRLKVVGVNLPDHDARLWPAEKEGRAVEAQRQASEATDAAHADAEVSKLGREIAFLVMAPFFEIDQEETRPREN